MPRTRRSSAALRAVLLSIGLIAAPASAAPVAPDEPSPNATAALYGGQVQLQYLVSGLVNPLGIVNAGDGTNRLFVVEQRGTVRVILNGQLQDGFFLDVQSAQGGLSTDGERGLLGLAFHPSFETNRKVFAYFTTNGADSAIGARGDIVIGEFTANDDGGAAGVNTFDLLLTIPHPGFNNHNGGQLTFGPDGALYAFVGDGGGGGDPAGNAQNDGVFLGKMLRLVPDLTGGASVAAWAKGLRNPWRASFDRLNGDLWIADVGQGAWEEINRVSGNPSGVNYGWNCREGAHPYTGCAPPPGQSFTDPVAEYANAGANCSITGGYVYRGPSYLDFRGQYVVGDFCSGNIWTADSANTAAGLQFHRAAGFMITSFGEDERGELYVADYGNGAIYKVVAPTFNDVIGSPFIDDITWLHYAGISLGCGDGNFCPGNVVTRDQMASFLARALSLPPPARDHFSDDDGSIHEVDINRIADAGITVGCAAGRYCPGDPVTRAEMASFLARALSLPASPNDYFWDDNGNIHEGNINAVAQAGITLGCGGGQYCPASPTMREQMAAFLRRSLD